MLDKERINQTLTWYVQNTDITMFADLTFLKQASTRFEGNMFLLNIDSV